MTDETAKQLAEAITQLAISLRLLSSPNQLAGGINWGPMPTIRVQCDCHSFRYQGTSGGQQKGGGSG